MRMKRRISKMKCKEDFPEGKRIYTSILTSAKKALSITRASIPLTTPTVSTVLRSRPPKTVDMLKPKKPLNKEMNLEEANQWLKLYRAHLTYNASTLVKQPINVQRAMLEVDLDLKMVSALQTHEKVKDETVIDAKAPTVSCLGRLIFLAKNPVWLRRHWYFCCTQ